MRTFTDTYIKSLKPKDKRYEIFQSRGFGIRVSPKNTKSWIYFYKFNNRMRRLTLGNYPELSLAEANKLHADAYDLRKRGIDPGLQKLRLLDQEKDSPSIAMLADEYLNRHAKKKKKSWREDERIINKDVLPNWRSVSAKDITRRDVNLLLDQIVDRGSPTAANRTFEIIRRMFNFGIERGILENSPCYMVKKPARESRRQRVLNADEIQNLWKELSNMRCHPNIPLSLKLMLITCQRRAEVSQANWKEFDFQSGWWTIPEDRVKNGLQHRVYLSDLAIEILEQIRKNEPGSTWLLPSPRVMDQESMRAHAVSRAIHSNRDIFSIKNWTPHDLRRTGASFITSLGITRLVVAKILNHAESDITAVYDRHSYDDEKKNALIAWSRKLNSITVGEKSNNVVVNF